MFDGSLIFGVLISYYERRAIQCVEARKWGMFSMYIPVVCLTVPCVGSTIYYMHFSIFYTHVITIFDTPKYNFLKLETCW